MMQTYTYKKVSSAIFKDFLKFPFYILTHPIDGFYEMKFNRQGLMKVATVFFLIHAILGIIEFSYTGFLFNTINPNQFNFTRSILVSVAPYLIFIVANWSITSLMDGKGKFREIYMVVGYAFFPSIVFRIGAIFLSNYFTYEEGFFYHGTRSLGFGLTFLLIFMGIRSIHEYSLLRVITTIFLTFISMLIIVFLALLSFSLAQQIYVFIETIIREMTLRF